MGYESEKLATIKFITDFETPMYHLGEVQGSFNDEELKKYIKRFGTTDLLSHLAFMQYQVIKVMREVNSEIEENVSCDVKKPLPPNPPKDRIMRESGLFEI